MVAFVIFMREAKLILFKAPRRGTSCEFYIRKNLIHISKRGR